MDQQTTNVLRLDEIQAHQVTGLEIHFFRRAKVHSLAVVTGPKGEEKSIGFLGTARRTPKQWKRVDSVVAFIQANFLKSTPIEIIIKE
jgi:hypothetical protein